MTDAELQRIATYANGQRELVLLSTNLPEATWHHRVSRIERALATALAQAGTPASTEVARHTACNGPVNLQRWTLPAPHGQTALIALAETLATDHELGLGDDLHVLSD